MVRRTMELTGRVYSDEEFNRFFLRVFQHYGSQNGYILLGDTLPFLQYLQGKVSSIGIISNCPSRTVEEVLPMLNLHEYFKFFLCAETFGGQKPDYPIFGEAIKQIRFWDKLQEQGVSVHENGLRHGFKGDGYHDVLPEEVLHIGDNEAADYAGARAAGFQACLLNRKNNVKYNDWLIGPEYAGKSDQDLRENTFADLNNIISLMSHLP
jgi:FMN phosphatase YigB (HAD superfamily)